MRQTRHHNTHDESIYCRPMMGSTTHDDVFNVFNVCLKDIQQYFVNEAVHVLY